MTVPQEIQSLPSEQRAMLQSAPISELLPQLQGDDHRSASATFLLALLQENALDRRRFEDRSRDLETLAAEALWEPDDTTGTMALLEEILAGIAHAPTSPFLGGALQIVLDAVPIQTLGETLTRVYGLLPATTALSVVLPAWLRLIQNVPFKEFEQFFAICEGERISSNVRHWSPVWTELWTRIALDAEPSWWNATRQQCLQDANTAQDDPALRHSLDVWSKYLILRADFVQRDPLCREIDHGMQAVIRKSPAYRQHFLDLNESLLGDFSRLDRAFPLTGVDVEPGIKHAWYSVAAICVPRINSTVPAPAILTPVAWMTAHWPEPPQGIPWAPWRWAPMERWTMATLFLGLPCIGWAFGKWWNLLNGNDSPPYWWAAGCLLLACLLRPIMQRSNHRRGSAESLRMYRMLYRQDLVRYVCDHPMTRSELLQEVRRYVSADNRMAPFLQEAEHDAALWFYALAARVTA